MKPTFTVEINLPDELIGKLANAIGAAVAAQFEEEPEEEAETPESESKSSEESPFNTLKDAAKGFKDAHSADALNEILDSLMVDENSSIPKRLASIDEDDYDDVFKALHDYEPTQEEEPEELDADKVIDLLKEHKSNNSMVATKKIMQKHGVSSLGAVRSADQTTLANLVADVT